MRVNLNWGLVVDGIMTHLDEQLRVVVEPWMLEFVGDAARHYKPDVSKAPIRVYRSCNRFIYSGEQTAEDAHATATRPDARGR